LYHKFKYIIRKFKKIFKKMNFTGNNLPLIIGVINAFLDFNVVVCGLDSVVARRWINCMLVRHSLAAHFSIPLFKLFSNYHLPKLKP